MYRGTVKNNPKQFLKLVIQKNSEGQWQAGAANHMHLITFEKDNSQADNTEDSCRSSQEWTIQAQQQQQLHNRTAQGQPD